MDECVIAFGCGERDLYNHKYRSKYGIEDCFLLCLCLFHSIILVFVYVESLLFFIFWSVDPVGAQGKVIEVASSLGLRISVAVAHEVSSAKLGINIIFHYYEDACIVNVSFLCFLL